MNFRMASNSDIPQLVELRMLEQENDWKGQYPIDDKLKEQTRVAFEQMLNKTLFVWVAEENEKIVATTAVIPHQYLPQADEVSGKRGYLCNVYTCVQYRRKGLQKELMKLITEFARDVLKIARMDLHASLAPEVFEMYRNAGWQFVTNNARLFL